MRLMTGIIAIMIGLGALSALGAEGVPEEVRLRKFIDAHLAVARPLFKESALTNYRAAVSGKAEDYDKLKELDLAIRKLYSNREEYAMLKALKATGKVREPALARQLDLLINSYLPNQLDPELMARIVELSTKNLRRFNTFRGEIEGTTVTLNDINDILRDSTDSRRRELAWRASKQAGLAIADDLRQLVRLRNEGARKLGFANYRVMSLTTGEQDPAELDRIFGELDKLTAEPFKKAKAELDGVLAVKYKIDPSALMPWHYHDPFFQRAPLVYDVDLDSFYKDHDVKEIARRFYAGIGLPVDGILSRSDLYEKPGKDQHAFCTDIDREGDVRILCNIKNDEKWMETTLHELGHAVYSENHDRTAPFLLRDAAHAFTTEAVAMFFGRLSRNAWWMREELGLTAEQQKQVEEVSARYLRLQQLIFARWAMVMVEFEKALYADPDQDLNALWWQLVERYQGLRRPSGPADAGWASKPHFTIAPCYYHNYALGELLASQWQHHVVREVLKKESDRGVSYVGEKKVGVYFKENVFAPGTARPWNEMIRRATGEELTPKYFVEQFVK